MSTMVQEIRRFETGATRDTDEGKLDYEGFLNPLCVEAFAEYMHKHRVQPDGDLRDSDNWQKGMPKAQYLKSMWRHMVDLWKLTRGYGAVDRKTGLPISRKEAACAIWFNAQGYLWEVIREERDNGQVVD